MLDPKYLERFSDQLLGIIDTLTIAIISDMAKRIVKMGNVSESTKHQAEVLQNAGLVYKDTIKRVSQVSGYQKHEVQRMYEEAGVRNLKNEAVYYKQAGKEDIKLNQSNGMQRILQANIRKTCQELDNLTMTTAVRSQSAYIQACNRAQMKVSSGAFSYDKAIADAIKVICNTQQIKTVIMLKQLHMKEQDQNMPYGKGRSFVYLGLIRSMKTSMKRQDMEQGQVYVVGIADITFMRVFLEYQHHLIHKRCWMIILQRM